MDAVMTPTPTAAARSERFAQIPLAHLEPSAHNPRTHFDAGKLQELADSIVQKGIVEPLVVREFNDAGAYAAGTGGFEIIAGERRYRAALLAGLTTVPCLVRNYSDEDVLEIFVIENLQRDDLSPLEQARGFKQLLTANADRFSVATIASKVGMSPAWVWDRLKLLDLVPEVQALLEQERISVGHAIVLARLKPADQARAIEPDTGGLWEDDDGRSPNFFDEAHGEAEGRTGYDADPYADLKPVSIRELESWIEDHVRFDVAHAAQAQPLVFTDLATQVETAQQQPGRGKKVIAITFDHFVQADAKDDQERTYSAQSFRRADGTADHPGCEHSVLGVVVAGTGQGRSFQVCIARDRCRVHFGAEIAAKEKADKARAKGDTAKAAKVEKKQESAWQRQEREREERRKVWAPLKPLVEAAAIDQIKTLKTLTPAQAKYFESIGSCYINPGTARTVLGEQWHERLAAALLLSEIQGYSESFDSFIENTAKPLGLNLKPLVAVRDAHAKASAAAAPATTSKKAAPAKKARGRK